jgi:PadR family transcriptional regulator, regulatory protein PadR
VKEKTGEVVQGTLDMLIMKTLALEPMHGYGLAQRIEQISKGVFRVNAGSLFVALQRLERGALIRSEWNVSENNRRAKYYLLSERGRKRLSTAAREWGRQVAAIARILEA